MNTEMIPKVPAVPINKGRRAWPGASLVIPRTTGTQANGKKGRARRMGSELSVRDALLV